jgi:hypothetical protein
MVLADLSLLTGREIVAVDGVTVYDKISMKFRNEVPLQLRAGEARVVASVGKFLLPQCTLFLAGTALPPLSSAGGGDAIPGWAWLFVGACGVIPFVTLGGALPAAIGIGSAITNHRIASSKWKTATKLLMLSSVTLAAWVLLTLALGAVQGLGFPSAPDR